MAKADDEQPIFILERVEDSVWMKHPRWGNLRLGRFEAVCDELCRFLEAEDLGQCEEPRQQERAGSRVPYSD